MSTLTALARATALTAGVAQPIATVRHLHLVERPLVFVPLTMAGEANAPLAALVGTDPAAPRLLIVPQPRNRDQRFAFAAELAAEILPYLDGHCGATEPVAVDRGRDVRHRYVTAPQVLVPNAAGIGFVRLLGRSTRFRRTDGEHPVHESVPLLGRWLTFLAERAEHPGSSLLVAMTDALALHWATGQSALEDQNLAALLGWIAPPPGQDGPQAAALAEDPAISPPAGPATDPEFDNTRLAPAIAAYEAAADDEGARLLAYAALEELLRSQLAPTWELMWRGVTLLRGLRPGARVADRWAADRDAFTDYANYVRSGENRPQPRRDGAVAAAQRLDRLERAQASYAAQRAYDDPLVMAEYRLTGEAFAGEVTLAQPDRIDDSGRRPVLRPRIMVVTADAVTLRPGAVVYSPARPKQKATVVFVTPRDGATEVVLELSGGMGRALSAPPGSVPAVGERVTYTTLTDEYRPAAVFPPREETPWTHGGPPPEPGDSDHDAAEEWS